MKPQTLPYILTVGTLGAVALTGGALVSHFQTLATSSAKPQALTRSLAEMDRTVKSLGLEVQKRVALMQTVLTLEAGRGYPAQDPGLFRSLESFPQDALAITIFHAGASGMVPIARYYNLAFLRLSRLTAEDLQKIDATYPLPLTGGRSAQLVLLNRSTGLDGGKREVPLLTLVARAAAVGEPESAYLVAADFHGAFLADLLRAETSGETFLAFSSGKLLSHPNPHQSVTYANKALPEVIRQVAGSKNPSHLLQSVSQEDRDYFENSFATPFRDVFLVNRVSKDTVFRSSSNLIRDGKRITLLVGCLAAVLAFCFSLILSGNLRTSSVSPD